MSILSEHIGHLLGVLPGEILVCDSCGVEVQGHYLGDDCTEQDGDHLDWLERSREAVPA